MTDKEKGYRENKERGLDRRDFMAAGAAGMAAVALPSAGLSKKPDISFVETSCGKDRPRVLLAYASKCGSTGEIAENMAGEICGAGAACDLRLIDSVTDIKEYNAVIIGSCIRNFKWLPEAAKFVRDNEHLLAKMKVAYFMTCLQVVPEQPAISQKGLPPKDETAEQRRERVKGYLDYVLKGSPGVKPVDIGVFAGVLDLSRLKSTEKAMMKNLGFVEGDFRNLDAINAWARDMAWRLVEARKRSGK